MLPRGESVSNASDCAGALCAGARALCNSELLALRRKVAQPVNPAAAFSRVTEMTLRAIAR